MASDNRDIGVIDMDGLRRLQCEIPSRKAERKTSQLRVETSDARYYCFECQMKYHKYYQLVKHYQVKNHHVAMRRRNLTSFDLKEFKCPACPDEFADQLQLSTHCLMTGHFRVSSSSRKRLQPLASPVKVCPSPQYTDYSEDDEEEVELEGDLEIAPNFIIDEEDEDEYETLSDYPEAISRSWENIDSGESYRGSKSWRKAILQGLVPTQRALTG